MKFPLGEVPVWSLNITHCCPLLADQKAARRLKHRREGVTGGPAAFHLMGGCLQVGWLSLDLHDAPLCHALMELLLERMALIGYQWSRASW